MRPFVVCAFFKCSFDVGAFVKCSFVGLILSACFCPLTVGPIMLFLICNFDVLCLWRDLYEVLSILIFCIFSLNLIRRYTKPWHLAVCSCHVTDAFKCKSTLYCCLNVKELLAQSRCKIWSLSDCNWTWTQNH